MSRKGYPAEAIIAKLREAEVEQARETVRFRWLREDLGYGEDTLIADPPRLSF